MLCMFLVFGFNSFDDIINKNVENNSFTMTNESSVTTAKYVTSSMVSIEFPPKRDLLTKLLIFSGSFL